MFRCVFCLVVVAGILAPWSGAFGQAPSKPLAVKLKEFAAALEADPDPAKLDRALLKSVIDELNAGLARRDGITPEEESIATLLELLKSTTKDNISTRPQSLVDAIRALAARFDELDAARDPAQAFRRVGARATELLTVQKISASDTAILSVVDPLFTAMMSFKGSDLHKKTLDLLRALVSVLEADKPAGRLLGNDPIAGELGKLYALLVPYAARSEPRIHIVAAVYGDRGRIHEILAQVAAGQTVSPGQLDRWCNATAAMKTQCERQGRCTGPAAFNTSLCGYDPAPFVSPASKTAVVFYECVANNNGGFWNSSISQTESTGSIPANVERGRQSVSLWNDKQSVFCAPPG